MSAANGVPPDPALLESRAHIPIIVVTVVLCLASTAVGLRSYTRAQLIRQLGMDDIAAICALVLATGSGIMVASNTLYGAGRHIDVVDKTQLWKYFRTFYISIVLYNASLTAIKITFLLQYYRIFTTAGMRRVVTGALAFVSLWSISQLLVTIFTCTPIEAFWSPEKGGTCIPNLPFWYINAAGNILTDVIVFVVPLPALGGLNLRRSSKMLLLGIFSLGFFTCAISIIRIQYLRLSPDVTWDNVESSCWSISELCSGIICSCLPTLRPLLIKLVPSMGLGSTAASNGAKYKLQSSGRDGASGNDRDLKNIETGSSRGIVYPEDIELRGHESDEIDEEALVRDRVVPKGSSRVPYVPDGLGVSSVRTEIGAGRKSPQDPQWNRSPERGIEVKRDLVITKEIHR
ncbi:hypothetical protein B0T18DRAFT_403057 [Schizothecium vesticola]|uniref:Rhodopsin domain-containing protein n=1 Tax=Schizothecium vesticola TaxID=314040 RepID=A0AA40F638_9PEZI|nr:hypothetical protein B0T18DRAFT_403057 [Schizothecium vesticola]